MNTLEDYEKCVWKKRIEETKNIWKIISRELYPPIEGS